MTTYEALNEAEIREAAGHLRRAGSTQAAITLINGRNILFPLGDDWEGTSGIQARVTKPTERIDICVPYEEIAGILPYGLSEQVAEGSVSLGEVVAEPVSLMAFDELAETGEADNLYVLRTAIFRLRSAPQKIVIGDANDGRDTDLYFDWDYISRTSGGITSIGASWGPGASLGFERKLATKARAKVDGPGTLMAEACDHGDELRLFGFADFFESPEGTDNRHANLDVSFEGEDWLPAILTPGPPQASIVEPWVFAYFRPKGLILPVRGWERRTRPARFFGNVVHDEIDTDFGKRACYFLVRAARQLQVDSGLGVTQ